MRQNNKKRDEIKMREDVYGFKSYINVYNVDMKRMARPAGLLREMQECGSRQMADQRPSYDELLDKGQALMLSRLDMIIPREVYLDRCIHMALPQRESHFFEELSRAQERGNSGYDFKSVESGEL